MMVRRIQERKSWSDIERDILEEITRKLTLVDYLKCRQICRSWRCAIDDALIKNKYVTRASSVPLHASQFPFLILFPSTFRHNSPHDPAITAILSDITQEDTCYTIPTKTWEGYFDFDGIHVTSLHGWLVFQSYVENHSLLLYLTNPLSCEGFALPHLPLFSGKENNYYDSYPYTTTSVKLVFSSAPYSEEDFLVVACAQQCRISSKKQQLAFWKVNDKSWTLISNKESQLINFFDAFVILDWKLYAMNTTSGSVFVFNLRDSNNITFENLKLEQIQKGTGKYNIHQTCMLARDKDEILLVIHFCEKFCDIKGFRVFKLDMSGPRWIEVDDLGDRILLMDYTGIQVLSAKEIKLPGELNGGNFVFFVNNPFMKWWQQQQQHDFGVFSLKDKTITRFPLGRSSQVPGLIRCLWFMPSLW